MSSPAPESLPPDDEVGQEDQPTSRQEVSHEFRNDAVLSPAPVLSHFFCCVCGSPAGKDTFCCKAFGHPVCKLCQGELKIEVCPQLVGHNSKGEAQFCTSIIYQYLSVFREFMCEKTSVNCAYRDKGCDTEGSWEMIRAHQETCEIGNSPKDT